jgi:DNA-binding transcriptional ArsR family regulator
MSPAESAEVTNLFHALADPTRRAILGRLSLGPSSASALAGPLHVTVTAIGQHLRVLEATRLVRTRKVGRVRTCAIEPAGFARLEQWVGWHRSQWEARFDRLGDVLEEG